MIATLERPALVLNKLWQPVGVVTVARSLTKVWNESARIIDPTDFQLYTWEDWSELRPDEGAPYIQTGRLRLRVPEVISLTKYDRLPTSSVMFSRRNVFKRDHYTCQYCGRQPGSEELTIDHVIPKSSPDGLGKSTWENCVLACITCNVKKANRTPEQAGMRLRRQPIRPTWQPLYAARNVRINSWSKFVSEVYWNVALND